MNSDELRRAKIERQKILETFDDHDQIYGSSFRVCQRMDVEKASLDAVPLTLDTCVEDHFTHEACVKLHFDLIRLTTLEDQAWVKTCSWMYSEGMLVMNFRICLGRFWGDVGALVYTKHFF